MKLRDYQTRALNDLYTWFHQNPVGNPCVVLPTGAGKSVIIAEFCRQALQSWPTTRILMLTHARELVSQNAQRMRSVWPNAPLGIYSAGLNRRELGEPITFASVQSVANKAQGLGHIDLILVDECHAISHKDTGQYRQLIADLTKINPALRMVGLTGTPFRLGHGYITDGEDAIFSDLLYSVTITELLEKGHLAPLRSKHTAIEYDTTGVKKSGGDFVVSDLEKMVDTSEYNHAVVEEMMRRASDRKAWLIFCVGVSHAQNIADLLTENGIKTGCVTGKTPPAQRKQLLEDFAVGKLQALSNVGVLTTGFDAPRVDMLAMLRPTESVGLYCQIAGRGLRTHPDKSDCLVLDFAGNVGKHGPITNPKPPKSKGSKDDGEAPTKVCPKCEEVLASNIKICTACGYEYPVEEKEDVKMLKLHNDDILAKEVELSLSVKEWKWRVHTSRTSGKDMLAVTYYGKLLDVPVTEYITIQHEGFAGNKALRLLNQINTACGVKHACDDMTIMPLKQIVATMQTAIPPKAIEYTKDGKFSRITKRSWSSGQTV